MVTKFKLTVFVSFHFVISSVLSQNCEKFPSSYYRCIENNPNAKCSTYAILRANSHFSSLSNLSSFLSIPRSDLLEANAFSNAVDFLPRDQPVSIPIDCGCSSDGFFAAEVKKVSIQGESFFDIADSLEGLASCEAIGAKNPSASPWSLLEGTDVRVPLKCACPSAGDSSKFLVSYPVKEGDSLPELSLKFNVSQEALVSANGKYSTPGSGLVPGSTLVIPLDGRPVLGFLERPEESIRVKRPSKKRKKHRKMMVGVYVGIGIVGFFACLGVGAAIFSIKSKKRGAEDSIKNGGGADLEIQQLSLSIRTTSDKKVSFEGSQYNFEEASNYATPHKTRTESFAFEDLQKATEDFASTNLIGGSVFHGRLKGKDVAVKRVPPEAVSKIEFEILHEKAHRHPNVLRFLGTCSREGPDSDSFVVFEYAKNGSLKDWIHGGLAIKSHFIASCSCFLNWNQRVKICLDVATALQHMHHIMSPSYVHRSVRSRNIFLDEDFSARLGNLGLAKLSDDREIGYSAPEFLDQGEISTAADVFAYGVVLLEVLSGKPPVTRDEGNGDGGKTLVKLSDEIKRVLKSENAEELKGWIDSALGENYCFDGAVTLANLARSCVEDDVALRPNAGEIVEKLLRLVEEFPIVSTS